MGNTLVEGGTQLRVGISGMGGRWLVWDGNKNCILDTFICREVVRGVAGVAAATPFFEPGKIRNFVISFL